MKFIKYNKAFIITSVYARCTTLYRLELWEELEDCGYMDCPWIVGGDFNEKLGSLDFTQ